MSHKARIAALVLATLGLAACRAEVGANGFPNESGCDAGACTPCQSDGDCVAVVDCCGERNLCTHREDVPALCLKACPERDQPPVVVCSGGRCECGQ